MTANVRKKIVGGSEGGTRTGRRRGILAGDRRRARDEPVAKKEGAVELKIQHQGDQRQGGDGDEFPSSYHRTGGGAAGRPGQLSMVQLWGAGGSCSEEVESLARGDVDAKFQAIHDANYRPVGSPV